jgi:tRNA pseudouridine32 synthase/23S rRNA pseudouridine746 synthase
MPIAFDYQPPTTPLQILHQDKDLLVLAKPSGLLTNPGRGAHLADSLLSRVQQEFPQALLVHRLDAATSGIVVMALRRKAEAHLKQQFANRQVNKVYLARVWQQPAVAAAEILLPLCADLTSPPKNKVCWQQGKTAQTFYRMLPETATPEHALLALFPHTGRAHQLRVHMQSIGHPILGDALYGHADARNAAPRLLLHATQLQLQHPYSGAMLEFCHWPDQTEFQLEASPHLSWLQRPA